jgi:hypothetical protein
VELRRQRPDITRAVIKLNDSFQERAMPFRFLQLTGEGIQEA